MDWLWICAVLLLVLAVARELRVADPTPQAGTVARLTGWAGKCETCGEIVNDRNPIEESHRADMHWSEYTYRCRCGAKTTFVFGPFPMPVWKSRFER